MNITKHDRVGFILYEGPSKFTGEPIVVIATGFGRESKNEKTGPVVQTYILCKNLTPFSALVNGQDCSVCGDCKLRNNGCYVDVPRSVAGVYRKYARGDYKRLETSTDFAVFENTKVRIGSYGDPYAVPIEVWENIRKYTPYTTGYTHQWRVTNAQELKKFCMASCDNETEMFVAHAMGWNTFRIVRNGECVYPHETECSNQNKMLNLTCYNCGICRGDREKYRWSVWIRPHGRGKDKV